MEIGAVKQAFNNELILLKKNLNQARLHIIHKLTRKAKQLTERKAPEALKEKLKRKAESAIREVLIIKKIKSKDIGKFAITHTGKLEDYLNKPQIDNDKACARLLLHKALQDKYKFLRSRFSNIPIKDLFMSRQERLKLKKEEKLKQKEKREKKRNKKNKVVNAEGDWDVEDVGSRKNPGDDVKLDDDELSVNVDNDVNPQFSDNDDQEMSDQSLDKEAVSEEIAQESGDDGDDDVQGGEESNQEDSSNIMDVNDDKESDKQSDSGKLVKIVPIAKEKKPVTINKKDKLNKIEILPKHTENTQNKPDSNKQKESNKNKKLKNKILNKKFKKNADDMPNEETKIVDSFFITATGGNYMSLAEPRAPDEFKEGHRQGNRKLRRAVMFGHVPKIKPRQNYDERNGKFDRQNNTFDRSNRFDKQSGFNRFDRGKQDQNNKYQRNNDNYNRNNKFGDNSARFDNSNNSRHEEKPEKLHPSWEAKKKQSGILPYQGKKIVFDG